MCLLYPSGGRTGDTSQVLAAARPRLIIEPRGRSERVERRVDPCPEKGGRCQGLGRSGEASQGKEREGAAGRVPARRPLTLAASAWA